MSTEQTAVNYFFYYINSGFSIEGLAGIILVLIICLTISKHKHNIEWLLLPIGILIQMSGMTVNILALIIFAIMFVMRVFGYSIIENFNLNNR